MSFSDNLQALRRRDGVTQEQLAERLEVSRQSVSKWESGASYPETEKLLIMCDLFGTDLDSLMRGDISAEAPADRFGYDRQKNRFNRAITWGVCLVLTGVSTFMLLPGLGVAEELALVFLMLFIAAGASWIVAESMMLGQFEKKHPQVDDFYTEEQRDTAHRRFTISLTSCIAIVLVDVALLSAMQALSAPAWLNDYVLGAIFLYIITVAATLIVGASLNLGKLNIAEYNREHAPAGTPEAEHEKKMGAIHAIIWCVAVAVFLVISFVYDAWNTSWLVFAVAGVLSGAVGAAEYLVSKKKGE